MSSGLTTREFRIEDYDAAVHLWTRVEGVEIAEGDSREDLIHYLSRNPGFSRVAEEGDKLVGVALCGHDGRRGFIYHLAIDPTCQQRGIGRRIIAECVDALRNAGLERALILVAGDNDAAHAFWRRCGWEDVPGALLMGMDL
jgi:ribosomal protein S18 acetylase RimI-like enzyme